MPPDEHRAAVVLRAAADRPSGERVAADLGRSAPGTRFVAVVVRRDAADLRGLLTGLRPVAAEVVLAGAAGPGDDPDAAVEVAGQDFAFEIPVLRDAMEWAIEAAGRQDITGSAVLVVGTAGTLAAVRGGLRARARG